jgi:hypothetical protein
MRPSTVFVNQPLDSNRNTRRKAEWDIPNRGIGLWSPVVFKDLFDGLRVVGGRLLRCLFATPARVPAAPLRARIMWWDMDHLPAEADPRLVEMDQLASTKTESRADENRRPRLHLLLTVLDATGPQKQPFEFALCQCLLSG